MSIRRTIARNTAFNAAGRTWEAVAGLVLTAYIFLQLGKADYGLWGVVAAFTGYAALFDLGVGSAYTKYIAEHEARGEKEAISSVVSTGFFFYLLFGCVFVSVTWPCVDLVVGFVGRLNPETAGDLGRAEVLENLRFLLRWGLVLFAVSNCIAPFTAVQTGLQRMGVTNVISVGASVVKIVSTVAFLELGHGVRGLLYTNAVVLALFGVASVAAAFYLHPSLRVSPLRVTREMLAKLVRFGWRTQVSRLSNLIMFETDILIIAFVLRDLELAGLYKIGVELANKMRQVPAIMLSALVPAASELDAREEDEKLQRLYRVGSKYVAAVAVPMAAFLAGASGLVMKTWIGSGAELVVAVVVLRIMALGYVANMVPGAGVTVALGKGRPDIQMKAGLISMVSNVFLTLLLVYTVGFWGIPTATAASMFLSWAWFAWAMGKAIDVGPGNLFRAALLWPVMAALPGFAICLAGDWLAFDLVGRLSNGAVLALTGGLFCVTYLGFIRMTPFIDGYDLEFFDDTLGLGRVPGYRAWTRRIRQRNPGRGT